MDYWEHVACPTAQKAIQQVGLLPKSVASGLTLTQILGTHETATPTPLQSLADSVGLMNGPQLFVLEDVTGAGKTEAALLLAQRLMRAGLAHGVYFGLPTMATANAMYQRLGEKRYTRLFEPGQRPTLVWPTAQPSCQKPFANRSWRMRGKRTATTANCKARPPTVPVVGRQPKKGTAR